MILSSRLIAILLINTLAFSLLSGKDTFEPYQKDEVPQNVIELWKDYNPRKESLNVKIIKEWQEKDVITRYITFTVGTFKGVPARIAAYYSFPVNGLKNPAFVWSHGGGQRADRSRGLYFAQQGYATVDINWLGRPLEKDITENTDWGKVDPTQGEQFYSKALRKQWKTNFQPDEHTIDPIMSPRNTNWFLLALAGRRAITFLEQQAEVDKDKLGFAGFSMGGMITSFNAIDKRLKAVIPFVGGTGFKHQNLPGVKNSSQAPHYRDLELYSNTMDSSAYWPLVSCPIMFISSSNDFHAAFERIYRSLALVRHNDWRVATDIHDNHGPDSEQWILLNKSFDHYLKGTAPLITKTPDSSFKVNGDKAKFTVTPDTKDKLVATEIYYSYDPNARTRFWNKATAIKKQNTWTAQIKVYDKLPIYTFAICRYKLAKTRKVQRGTTDTYTLNSLEHTHMPKNFDIKALKNIAKENPVFDDFSAGTKDWNIRKYMGMSTYKLQNSELKITPTQKLKFILDTQGKDLHLISVISSRFLQPNQNIGSLSLVKKVPKMGKQEVIISLKDFKFKEGTEADWRKVANLKIFLKETNSKHNLDLSEEQWLSYIKKVEIID